MPNLLEEVLTQAITNPKQPPITIPERDKRDAITKAIDSNSCATCRGRKLGRCICVVPFPEPIDPCNDDKALLSQSDVESEDEYGDDELTPQQEAMTQEVSSYDKYQPNRFHERTLHPETMLLFLDLLAKGVMNVERNPEEGTLNFGYQYRPEQQPGDRRQFAKLMDLMLEELENFRNLHNIKTNCHHMERDAFGSIMSLRIHFPMPMHYDRFILLLPAEQYAMLDRRKLMSQREQDRRLRPQLTRGNQSNSNDEDEEEEYISPIRLRSPMDRLKKLKPTGF